MKKTFTLHRTGTFYWVLNQDPPQSICDEFVVGYFNCPVVSKDITVHLSATRPHQKGWKKFVYDFDDVGEYPFVKIRGDKKLPLLPDQLEVLASIGVKNSGDVFYIKIDKS